jgi:hypothetical protein
VRTFIPISQLWFPTSKSPYIFPMSNNQNPSSPTLLFYNKLRFNLDFISWFASISKIHFQVPFFEFFVALNLRFFFFSRIFANLLHVNNFLVLFVYSLQPLESIFKIPSFCGFEFKVSFFFRTFAILLSFRIQIGLIS